MSTVGVTTQKATKPETPRYNFKDTLAASQKINWKIEDIIGGDKRLDFTRPFMPESLARVESLDFLNADEKRILNQIRGNAYLTIFGLVEEFILPFVMDHTRPQLDADDFQTRAYLQFAGEEAKHIHLFKRFAEEFQEGFGTDCAVIGPPSEIAKAVLTHQPLAVALVILQIEWMTQRHYLDSIADDQHLDAQFKSLLKHHWMEEAQHAKLDTLMVESLAAGCSTEEIEKAINEYLEIGGFLDGGLKMQTQFDLEAFERATNRKLTDKEREQFMIVQHQANRWTYLGSGITHPNFLATVEQLSPEARMRLETEVAPVFC
ncbi:MAG: diiron oxygenase [Acidobacteria bacterium]|nr:diiron oxygenase [Acidobacteriota bacterium]